MIEFWNNLQASIKITIIIALVGWLIAIWQTILAIRNRKSSVVFENRLKIYNEYFKKIDGINERLTIDFAEFIGPVLNQFYEKILTDPENINDKLIDLQRAAGNIITKSSATIMQATQELQTLRFIASNKTLEILNDYKRLAESQTKIVSELFGSINISNFQSYDINRNSTLKEVGTQLLETRDKLEKQMRDDLGLK
ncbi:MAG: hypothetical protein ACFFCW_42555 [Candidatus Hodarchaeota archaeon]